MSRYFYEINFTNILLKGMKTEIMEVIKTDSGWKRTKYGRSRNFDELIADLDPKVIRELHEE